MPRLKSSITTYLTNQCRGLHQETCHKPFWARTSSYGWKSQEVEKGPRTQKQLIPEFIFRRGEKFKKPLFFFKSRKVKKLMDIFLMTGCVMALRLLILRLSPRINHKVGVAIASASDRGITRRRGKPTRSPLLAFVQFL